MVSLQVHGFRFKKNWCSGICKKVAEKKSPRFPVQSELVIRDLQKSCKRKKKMPEVSRPPKCVRRRKEKVVKLPSSDGVKVVKPKRSRKEKKQCQGTSPKVRLDRLKQTIKDLTFHQEVLQLNYNNQTTELYKVLAERDSARTQLKISEKTAEHRLTLIQREVPNFVRGVLKGNFDRYKANL